MSEGALEGISWSWGDIGASRPADGVGVGGCLISAGMGTLVTPPGNTMMVSGVGVFVIGMAGGPWDVPRWWLSL